MSQYWKCYVFKLIGVPVNWMSQYWKYYVFKLIGVPVNVFYPSTLVTASL